MLQKKQPKSTKELKQIIVEERNNITTEKSQNMLWVLKSSFENFKLTKIYTYW